MTYTLNADGTPNITGLPGDSITSNGNEYMRRYYTGPDLGERLHHLLTDDPQPDMHDHPWNFTTTILTGGYREHTPDGTHDRHAGDTIYHIAEDFHRIELIDGPTWTYVTCGPLLRRWGFLTSRGWQHWRKYHAAHRLDVMVTEL